MYERGLNPSWRVVVLDDEECKLFFDQRLQLINYKDVVFGSTDHIEEWDEGNHLPMIHFVHALFPAQIIN